MKPKDFLTDIKLWIGLVAFFVMIGVAFAGVIKLPKRVEKVEVKAEQTENSVQQLAGSLDKYIAKQEVLKDEQDKREKLIIELIKDVSKK